MGFGWVYNKTFQIYGFLETENHMKGVLVLTVQKLFTYHVTENQLVFLDHTCQLIHILIKTNTLSFAKNRKIETVKKCSICIDTMKNWHKEVYFPQNVWIFFRWGIGGKQQPIFILLSDCLLHDGYSRNLYKSGPSFNCFGIKLKFRFLCSLKFLEIKENKKRKLRRFFSVKKYKNQKSK